MYTGQTYRIFCIGGWNGNPNYDKVSHEAMIDVNNANLHNGGRQPRGGTEYENIICDYTAWMAVMAVEANQWRSVTYGGGIFIAISYDGTNRIMRSDDLGFTWSAIAATSASGWWSVAYGNEVFVAVAGDGLVLMRSTDYGLTWSSITATEANSWLSVTYGNGVFVAVSSDGTNRVMRSTDLGLTWSAVAAAEANTWKSVAYGNRVFVAVASDGTNRTMYSTDLGLTWTAVAAAEANEWQSITYGDGIFIAVASSGTNRTMYSDDLGASWTAVAATEANTWLSVTYGNGTFMAISYNGTNRIMQSTDLGLTWSAIAAAEANGWRSITYGNGIFVAISEDGTNRVMRIDAIKITGIYQFLREDGELQGAYIIDEGSDNIGDENGNKLISEGADLITCTNDGVIQQNYETELKTGLTSNKQCYFETFYNELFISNGSNCPQVWGEGRSYTWDMGSPIACTAALAGDGAGNVDDGTHSYQITFVTADGESTGGVTSNQIEVLDKASDGKVDLTGIEVGPSGTTSRKIYRTAAGDTGDYLLVDTISDNTTTIYEDNTADSGLGAAAPTTSLAFLPTSWVTNYPKYFIRHGRGPSKRLWAFGCESTPNFMYASKNGQADFSDSNVVAIKILCSKITGAVEFGGNLIVFSPDKTFLIDDTALTVANWGYHAATWDGGVAHQKLIIKTPIDVAVMSEDGNVFSIVASQQYGDYEIASLTRKDYIHKWIADNVDLSQIDKFHAIYDLELRAIKIFAVLNGESFPTVCLVYFIDTKLWTKHTFKIQSLYSALIQAAVADWKIYIGDRNGIIYSLESSILRDADAIYDIDFTIPPLAFDNPRSSKRYDKLWLIMKSLGTETLYADNSVDDNDLTQQSVTMTEAKDILMNYGVDIGTTGRRIKTKISNTLGEDFFISQLLYDFTDLGSTP